MDNYKPITNGTVFRVEKERNYTCIDNQPLCVKNMSLKAKGLLCVILSLPDTWDYSLAGLCAICKESIGTIRTTLDELKKLGYVEIKKYLPNETDDGRIHYEYIIHERSITPDKLIMIWDK